MTRVLVALLSLFAARATDPPASADSGAAWLRRIDEVAHVDDAHLILDLTVGRSTSDGTAFAPNAPRAARTIEVWQKGDDRRLVRINAPARLKGVGLLVTPGDVIHLFLPQYPPSRRIVGSKRADAFMGTDFSVDDLSRMSLAAHYDATVEGRDGELTRLKLVSHDGETTMEVWADTEGVVRRIDHLDRKGQVTRRLVMEDVRPEHGVPLAHRLSVADLVHHRRTVAELRSVQIDTGLSDDLFTVTNLERP